MSTITRGQTKAFGENFVQGTYLTVEVEGGSRQVVQMGQTYYDLCGRCDSMAEAGGRIEWAKHVLDGVCFKCGGRGVGKAIVSGSEEDLVKVIARRVKAQARRDAKREAEYAAKRAVSETKVEAWRQANPEAAALVEEVMAPVRASYPADGQQWDYEAVEDARWAATERWGNFIVTLASEVDYVGREGMTEAQTAAFVEAVAKVKAREAAAQQRAQESRYLGAEGDKVAVDGVVEVATSIETQYGMSRLVVVRGTGEHEGVTVKAFGSGATLWDVRKGDVVTIAGAVKGHEERDGVRQTQVTRAKVTVTEAAQA